ncbi:fimbria/pilus periplasmic chaperone [Escherichia coli]|uniref:fimbria/pilus periplasmic chaperone n=2 Tax=Escherichia coli TaxID=562 RepID=UPI00069841FF|nr:fimbria/pilus periplasmic chaperone [Escherichia coli]EEC7356368.1 fimbria/pilus periplasmic chaperone [Escherichia coli]EES4346654.1 fimbria/pilus periplasmic chaperone [Escherichia coli]EEY7020786.1 fimbria/pilus periplasmic chaperone [Escherichia coli]EEY7147007.1 fimbria/pilus periplasmic chaperone [Escherichia coli]EFD4218702.1 fimbria/pilus periplasmic chaperone [Escherichia coli]
MSMTNKLKAIIFTFSTVSVTAFANEETIGMHVKEFSLKIDRTRLIVSGNGRGSLLTFENSHDYPMLVQTRIISEDKKTKTENFIATPPLFKLNEGVKSKIRIYTNNVKNLSKDRESLFWVCAKGIPPTDKDIWAIENEKSIKSNKSVLGVNLAVENCIKLFYRPKGVPSVTFKGGGDIIWSVQNGKLKAYNPTPNYINFKRIFINGSPITQPGYIQPFSEKIYDIKVSGKKNIEWSVITDFGGEGNKYYDKIK